MRPVPYDIFTGAFLAKVQEFDFGDMADFERNGVVDGYMRRAMSEFDKVCRRRMLSAADDVLREFDMEVPDEDVDELAEIISEGMVVQWMKPYLYRQEGLENVLTTRDFTAYSPANLLKSIGDAYARVRRDFTNKMRVYSYDHGDLTDLHL